MKGLSNQEIKVISELEFYQKYYFTKKDIIHHFDNPKEIKDFIYHLKKKGRIVKINRSKYYLVPVKARTGKWTDNPTIIADEICNGKDYYIGGWYAASYWKLTDQIPMQVDVYTTRRQGKVKIMNTRFVFHRTTEKGIEKTIVEKINGHGIRMMSYGDSKEWLKSRK